MYGVVLILVLIITGGAIAFIGDRIGSKVGKKKMTVLGLRPRHTSILVTIVTGVLITTMTLGVMSIMSENVRTALFGMEKLYKNMEQAKTDLAETSAQLAMAKSEQENVKKELADTQKELSGLHQQKDELEQRTTELQSINANLEDNNRQLTENNHQLVQKSDKLTRINNILEEGNERLSKNNNQLYQINQELTTGIRIMREGSIAFQAGETLASDIIKGKSSIDDIHASMGRLLEMARFTVVRKLRGDLSDKDKDVWIYQPEFDEAAQYISENEGDFVVRVVAAGNLIQGEAVATTLQVFKNKEVYQDGDLITQQEISFNPKDTGELQTVLTKFLTQVNHKATENGMIPDAVSGTVGVIDSQEVYSIMEQMQNSNGKGIISAIADGVTDIIGPLRIKLKLLGTGAMP